MIHYSFNAVQIHAFNEGIETAVFVLEELKQFYQTLQVRSSTRMGNIADFSHL